LLSKLVAVKALQEMQHVPAVSSYLLALQPSLFSILNHTQMPAAALLAESDITQTSRCSSSLM
jgi:hypothetical protein